MVPLIGSVLDVPSLLLVAIFLWVAKCEVKKGV